MDDFSMYNEILTDWNNPNYLEDVEANRGWSNQWCRLCGTRGKTASGGTRSPMICDKCKKKEI